MEKKHRFTVGCRARILTLAEKPPQTETKDGHYMNESSWRKDYGDREVILVERSHGTFTVMLLGEGVKKLKKEDPHTVDDEMAWIDEEDMVLVDKDFDTNLDFIDWYQEHEDEFCGDCGAWFPENGRDWFLCPNKECPSHKY